MLSVMSRMTLFTVAVGATGINAQWVASSLLVMAVGGLVSGVIASVVATRVLKAKGEGLDRRVAAHESNLAALREERLHCEVRASQSYATHGEVGSLFRDAVFDAQQITGKLDDVHKRIDQVHDRVTNVQTAVARLEGAKQAVLARQGESHGH